MALSGIRTAAAALRPVSARAGRALRVLCNGPEPDHQIDGSPLMPAPLRAGPFPLNKSSDDLDYFNQDAGRAEDGYGYRDPHAVIRDAILELAIIGFVQLTIRKRNRLRHSMEEFGLSRFRVGKVLDSSADDRSDFLGVRHLLGGNVCDGRSERLEERLEFIGMHLEFVKM